MGDREELFKLQQSIENRPSVNLDNSTFTEQMLLYRLVLHCYLHIAHINGIGLSTDMTMNRVQDIGISQLGSR